MKFKDYLNKKSSYKENYSKIEIDVKDNINNQLKDNKKQKLTFNFAIASKVFACLLIIGLFVYINIYLFSPFPTSPKSMSKYKDNEYYEVIDKINVLTFDKPIYKNNADRIINGIGRFFKNLFSFKFGVGDSVPPTSEAPGASYVETTDNQVAGIIEGDLIKRSSEHIFYLDKDILKVFSIEQENSKMISQLELASHIPLFNANRDTEMYLSKDCKTITIINPYGYNQNNTIVTVAINIDVSDVLNLKFTNYIEIAGQYLSSRLVNDELLIITNFYIYENMLDYEETETFIPFYKVNNEINFVKGENIEIAENASNTTYSVLTKINQKTLDVIDQGAFLSYSSNVYVSNEFIYLTNPFILKTDINTYNAYSEISYTEISIVNYKNEFIEKGTISIQGNVLNQYSMDEYNGYLRVVTTVNISNLKQYPDYVSLFSREINCNLFIIDLETNNVINSVLKFAPNGESVKSVRFDKDIAYVCTAVERTDPVFMFNLSDVHDIKVKDTGTIPGFSTSLINLNNGYLLGMGEDEYGQAKVEIYKESNNNVISVCSYVVNNSTPSSFYKSYFIDRENNLFGFGYYRYDQGYQKRYCLLQFNIDELIVIFDVKHGDNPTRNRAVLIDGYFYLFGDKDFKVERI